MVHVLISQMAKFKKNSGVVVIMLVLLAFHGVYGLFNGISEIVANQMLHQPVTCSFSSRTILSAG